MTGSNAVVAETVQMPFAKLMHKQKAPSASGEETDGALIAGGQRGGWKMTGHWGGTQVSPGWEIKNQ